MVKPDYPFINKNALFQLVTRHSPLILLLAFSAFAWLPLVTPGYFLRAHDAPHSLFFLQAFDEAIRDGAWWPAWGPHFAFGYGYPLWIFYAPLAYYVGEAFHLLGFSLTTSIKLVDLVATVGATLSMYIWARKHFNPNAAAFAAIVYTYAPYHLLDLYVRSAVSEYFTFVWFPLVLWRWELLLESSSRRNAMLAALVTAALILTHHGAAFIFAMLLAAYLLFLFARIYVKQKNIGQVTRERGHSGQETLSLVPSPLSLVSVSLSYAFIAGTLTLGLSAIFWLPMLLEQKYIVVEQWTSVAYNYQKHFIFLNQFFSPFWGYEYSGEGLADGMAFQLGLVPIVMGIVLVLWNKGQGIEDKRRATFFFVTSLVVVLLMSPISAAFWNALPLAALVQFPWRLLALSCITLAWLAGAALANLQIRIPFRGHNPKSQIPIDQVQQPTTNEQSSNLLGIRSPDPQLSITNYQLPVALLMLITVFASFTYTLPQYTERSVTSESARASVDFELVSYKDRTGYMTWATAQPQTSPLVREYQNDLPLTRAIALTPDAQVESLHQGGTVQRVRVRSANGTTLQFRVYYFPGWRAYVDDKPVALWPSSSYALSTLAVPAGEHEVTLRFEDTHLRFAAKLITVITIGVMIGWALWRKTEG
jgi:hypothetical protein